jgi:hypothetical protein
VGNEGVRHGCGGSACVVEKAARVGILAIVAVTVAVAVAVAVGASQSLEKLLGDVGRDTRSVIEMGEKGEVVSQSAFCVLAQLASGIGAAADGIELIGGIWWGLVAGC